MTATLAFDIRSFDAPLGAEVIGLDLGQPLAAEAFARIHRARCRVGQLANCPLVGRTVLGPRNSHSFG